jgi:hypothetical protein
MNRRKFIKALTLMIGTLTAIPTRLIAYTPRPRSNEVIKPMVWHRWNGSGWMPINMSIAEATLVYGEGYFLRTDIKNLSVYDFSAKKRVNIAFISQTNTER